jgi:hypothetical protein
MATPTYTLIDSVTLTSSASSVSFTGISATGKGDLVFVIESASTDNGGDNIRLRFNGDSGTNYYMVSMEGNGSAARSDSSSSNGIINTYWDIHHSGSVNKGFVTYQIMDYSASDKQTSVLVRSGRASSGISAVAGRWNNSAAVTSVSVQYGNPAASFSATSTFHLYQLVSE